MSEGRVLEVPWLLRCSAAVVRVGCRNSYFERQIPAPSKGRCLVPCPRLALAPGDGKAAVHSHNPISYSVLHLPAPVSTMYKYVCTSSMSRRRHGDKNNLAENTQEAAGRRLCSRSLCQVEWKLHKNWSKECCQKRANSKISRGVSCVWWKALPVLHSSCRVESI